MTTDDSISTAVVAAAAAAAAGTWNSFLVAAFLIRRVT